MEGFRDLSYQQQCLLVGKVARMYDNDMSIQKIAEALDESVELIHDVVGIILVAREAKNYS